MLAISRRSSAFTISATRAFPMPLPCNPSLTLDDRALHAITQLHFNTQGIWVRVRLRDEAILIRHNARHAQCRPCLELGVDQHVPDGGVEHVVRGP